MRARVPDGRGAPGSGRRRQSDTVKMAARRMFRATLFVKSEFNLGHSNDSEVREWKELRKNKAKERFSRLLS